jgi:hypothetical protein
MDKENQKQILSTEGETRKFQPISFYVSGAILASALAIGGCASNQVDQSTASAGTVSQASQQEPQAETLSASAKQDSKTIDTNPTNSKNVPEPTQATTTVELSGTPQDVQNTSNAASSNVNNKTSNVPNSSVKGPRKETQVTEVQVQAGNALVEQEAEPEVASSDRVQTSDVEPVNTVEESTPVQVTPAPEENKQIDTALLNKLPMSVKAWTLAKNPLSKEGKPYMKSLTSQMGDGEYSSQIWFTVEDGYLAVNSTSDIDTRGTEAGIQINGGGFIPFSRYSGKSSAVIDQNLLGQLDDGGKINVKLAFFPDRNASPDFQTAEVSIDPLKQLIPAYRSITN